MTRRVALLVAAGWLAVGAAPAVPVVTTADGPIRGTVEHDGRLAFRGVPFAAAPVGALRWRAPQPVARWRSVRDATRSAAACRQPDLGWNHDAAAHQSEDCLYLEVATPALHPARPMPVMVWIHGGANWAGGGAGTIASSLGRRGIVLVSIQYRLGVFGFLSHPALTREQRGASGNYALMDQQAALRWVRANVAAFGGDPRNVTIFGESAGAQDVGLQQVSPGGRGLFAKAIEQSGTPQFGLPTRSLAQNEAIGEQLTGISATASVQALRAVPGERLLAAQAAFDLPGIGDYLWLQTTVDGRAIVEPPAATLVRGGGHVVPLIVGNNARELGLYGGNSADRLIARAFGARAAAARTFYAAEPAVDPVLGDRDTRLADDVTFRCPSDVVAAARVRAGAPVWRYEFAHVAPDGKPVTHGSDLRYVMGDGEGEAGAPPLQAYWAAFARTGNPSAAGLPAWPSYGVAARRMVFANRGVIAMGNPRAAICRLRAVP